MSIKINAAEFMPSIEKYAATHRREFSDQSMTLSEEVLAKAQEFFDSEPWVGADPSHYETKLQTRCTMKLWIYDRIDLKDHKKAWFIPSFIWYWAASRLISYIVKLILDRYWPDLVSEMGNK